METLDVFSVGTYSAQGGGFIYGLDPLIYRWCGWVMHRGINR